MKIQASAMLVSTCVLICANLINAGPAPSGTGHLVGIPGANRHGAAGASRVSNADCFPQRPAVEIIYRFPNNTWLENLAVRSNGQILVTDMSTPDLYLVDPTNPKPVLVHSFTNHLSLLGIAELGHDIFYVIAGNYSHPTNINAPGVYNVYRVDMNVQLAAVTLSAHFPDAILLNGMAAISIDADFLLIGDAGAGVVYRLCVNTGAVSVAIDDPTMKPPSGASIGIDGLQIHDKNLYFTNAPEGLFYKIPLHVDGTAAGSAEQLFNGWGMDDFTFDQAGNAYLTVFISNEIAVWQNGVKNASTLIASSSELAGPTACKFGRLPSDRDSLYVTTNGGLRVADESRTPGGTLSRVNLGQSNHWGRVMKDNITAY